MAVRELVLAQPDAVNDICGRVREVGETLKSSIQTTTHALVSLLARSIPSDTLKPEISRLCAKEPIVSLANGFRRASVAPDELMPSIMFQRTVVEAREDGLAAILDAYEEAGKHYAELVPVYERVLYRSLAKSLIEKFPTWQRGGGLSLGDIRAQFQNLDVRVMEMQRQSLVAKLSSAPIPEGIKSQKKGECTEAVLIRNEVAKKMRHIPLRDLFSRASNAIRAMKPCFMMSPSSVAQYVNPDHAFDLVIIDEASQMRPEEAIGALARAKQAVIVGDTKQLPPSNFFARQDSAVSQENDEEFEKIVSESILDAATAAFEPMRKLLWHYRSKIGSLINFSNRHFYDDELIVFPSPQEWAADFGVRFVQVDGKYRTRINVPEAQAVALAAVKFMATNPDKSLGIVALNQAQRDLILAEMDRIFVRDSKSEQYRAHWQNTLEPFFVKNLENVQGDERDVIFISTVYGPDENGNLMQRFGPINGAAGDRRLNVLFSRAKFGVTVFSSMRPDQIRVDEKTPRGTRLLKEYLQYAATGTLESGNVTVQECDSDFELIVKRQLESRGYEVVPQIGVAGFRIDLGVKHPDWPYGFLLGIECDGAAYHSSLSARDRDRLRQQVLESLGWTIYRVWSTDWFHDQKGELVKMSAFIEATLQRALGSTSQSAKPMRQ